MDKGVVEQILKILPEHIIYISCHPATQARDAEMLYDNYEILEIQPVDMFPHTAHIENVDIDARKGSAFGAGCGGSCGGC